MRITVVATVQAMLLAVGGGCGPKSQLDPNANVTVQGTIEAESGAPSAATPVKLIRHPDALQALGELFVAIGSVGLACVAGQLDICKSFRDSTSAADGGYTFAMDGMETQGSQGQALTFTTFAGCPGGNCAVASDFIIQKTALTIPPLRFWTELGTLADDASGDSQLSWPAVEASVGGAAADNYRINIVAPEGTLWWTQDALESTTATIDRRVTQDKDATWHVVARRAQSASGTDFTVYWYSTQQTYPNRNATPISRADDCYTQGPDGMPALLARPCPLTDGNPATTFVPVTQQCANGQPCPPINNWILIDNSISHPLGFLVLYDVSVSNSTASIIVETSDDLNAWTTAATLPAKPYQTTALNATARFVRLRLSDPNAQWNGGGNGEVAVFAPF
ncbi:MAG TPA: hypothetical protein VHB97_25950 [Polyangia bacterium]|jgi:hypothetical protein|nr:hypothetical protein [Polyangia bacterium]